MNRKIKKNEQSLRYTMGVSEGKERGKRSERVFEDIMFKNFQNRMKIINLHIQEAQQDPSRANSKKSTSLSNY